MKWIISDAGAEQLICSAGRHASLLAHGGGDRAGAAARPAWTHPGGRMILAFTFWSQPQVVTDSWVELASTITLIAFVIGAYKHLECHADGCHRIGRFQHGHYKLCRIHHPDVPNDGKIGQKEIDEVTTKLAKVAPVAKADHQT